MVVKTVVSLVLEEDGNYSDVNLPPLTNGVTVCVTFLHTLRFPYETPFFLNSSLG